MRGGGASGVWKAGRVVGSSGDGEVEERGW